MEETTAESTVQPSTRDLLRSALSLRHLNSLTGEIGIFEHARHNVIRVEHGLCTDDNARLAALTARTTGVRGLPPQDLHRLALTAARFVLDSIVDDGMVLNRRHPDGRWLDDPQIGDSWGRAVHALGTIAASGGPLAGEALAAFERTATQRTHHLRAMAHAAIGAAAVAETRPGHPGALNLLADTSDLIWSAPATAEWPWPEARLTYANGLIPEALIASASLLGREDEMIDALGLLRWLVQIETIDGRISPTSTSGRGPGDNGPKFDQQPIEVAALASAAARASMHHADPMWPTTVRSAVAWFLGRNDSGYVMIDHRTGGGYDGLHADGVNLNQGAESTIAMTETLVLALGMVQSK